MIIPNAEHPHAQEIEKWTDEYTDEIVQEAIKPQSDGFLPIRQNRTGGCFGTSHERSFSGAQMVQWLIKKGYAVDASQAVRLGQKMFDQGKLNHVNRDTHFQDDPNLIYML